MRTFIVILLLLAFMAGCAGFQNPWYYQRYSTKYTKANKWSNPYASQLKPTDIITIYNYYNTMSSTTSTTGN
ncbi:MAG: hypothetical protein N3B13_03870 [Deltaproteobacteria bacterium]|nr:hypothetical protein [Deltaproteobacteria bacterium]